MCAGDTHRMCLCVCFCVVVESISLELVTDIFQSLGWEMGPLERSNFILEDKGKWVSL